MKFHRCATKLYPRTTQAHFDPQPLCARAHSSRPPLSSEPLTIGRLSLIAEQWKLQCWCPPPSPGISSSGRVEVRVPGPPSRHLAQLLHCKDHVLWDEQALPGFRSFPCWTVPAPPAHLSPAPSLRGPWHFSLRGQVHSQRLQCTSPRSPGVTGANFSDSPPASRRH